MHHLSPLSRKERRHYSPVRGMSRFGKGSSRCFELNHMLHRLCGFPINSFEFHSCERTPQVEYLLRLRRHRRTLSPTPSIHRLRRGLPGYLILFAPHAFEPQRQLLSSKAAFATGVPPNIYAFNRYTRNSAYLSSTLVKQFPKQSRG